jgi:hypothetical protein
VCKMAPVTGTFLPRTLFNHSNKASSTSSYAAVLNLFRCGSKAASSKAVSIFPLSLIMVERVEFAMPNSFAICPWIHAGQNVNLLPSESGLYLWETMIFASKQPYLRIKQYFSPRSNEIHSCYPVFCGIRFVLSEENVLYCMTSRLGPRKYFVLIDISS